MESTENRYKYIFDEILTLTDDGFVVVDTNGVITDINDQYCKYLKTTKEYAIGRSIAEIIPNTKMIDIVNYGYREEGAILRLSEERDDENDSIFLVNRSCVYDDDHKVIAGVAQVKFRLQTLDRHWTVPRSLCGNMPLMSFTVRNTKTAATANVPLIKSSATAAVSRK